MGEAGKVSNEHLASFLLDPEIIYRRRARQRDQTTRTAGAKALRQEGTELVQGQQVFQEIDQGMAGIQGQDQEDIIWTFAGHTFRYLDSAL